MALFSTPQEERPRSQAQRGEPGLSIIASGMRVEGELDGEPWRLVPADAVVPPLVR